MKKIPSLFQRNYDGNRLIRDEVTPGCEWALTEGFATAKWDGTAVKVSGNTMYKRYDAKNDKVPPAGFIPAQDPDPVTGHWPGWLPVTPQDKWHVSVLGEKPYSMLRQYFPPGTYELIGPKINGNPHNVPEHMLIRHGAADLKIPAPRTFESIRARLAEDTEVEGVVFYRYLRRGFPGQRIGDIRGDMCKVKRKDYGLPWPPVEVQC